MLGGDLRHGNCVIELSLASVGKSNYGHDASYQTRIERGAAFARPAPAIGWCALVGSNH